MYMNNKSKTGLGTVHALCVLCTAGAEHSVLACRQASAAWRPVCGDPAGGGSRRLHLQGVLPHQHQGCVPFSYVVECIVHDVLNPLVIFFAHNAYYCVHCNVACVCVCRDAFN